MKNECPCKIGAITKVGTSLLANKCGNTSTDENNEGITVQFRLDDSSTVIPTYGRGKLKNSLLQTQKPEATIGL